MHIQHLVIPFIVTLVSLCASTAQQVIILFHRSVIRQIKKRVFLPVNPLLHVIDGSKGSVCPYQCIMVTSTVITLHFSDNSFSNCQCGASEYTVQLYIKNNNYYNNFQLFMLSVESSSRSLKPQAETFGITIVCRATTYNVSPPSSYHQNRQTKMIHSPYHLSLLTLHQYCKHMITLHHFLCLQHIL